MTLEIAIVLALVVGALIAFAGEWLRVDVTAVSVMAILMLTGILSPTEGVAGFSNVATVTVGAMFILSAGIRKTGALEVVAALFTRLGQRHEALALGSLMLVIGVISAFINNTAAVAIFIPVVIGLSKELGRSPSKLLMPMSFAAMFGGVCTLIGTSTNLLVDGIARNEGLAPFGLFEFARLGIVFFVVGMIYLFVVERFIPARRKVEDLASSYELEGYLTDVELGEDAPYIGELLGETSMSDDFDVDIVQVTRGDEKIPGTDRALELEAADVIRVLGSASEIGKLLEVDGLEPAAASQYPDEKIETQRDALVEGVIAPDSRLEGRTIRGVDFPKQFGAQVLAIREQGNLQQEHLGSVTLRGGTSLLLTISRDRLPQVRQEQDFVVVSEVNVADTRTEKMPIAIGTVVGVVALAGLGVVPILESAIAGCIVMILSGVLRAEEAYAAVNWRIIFLLGGILSLGTALETTGAAELLASAHREIESAGRFHDQVATLAAELADIVASAQAVGAELEDFLDDFESDVSRLDAVETRISQIEGLKRKYGASLDDVLAFRDQLGAELTALESDESDLARLETRLEALAGELERTGRGLSLARHDAGKALAEGVAKLLPRLAMPDARFEVAFEPSSEFGAHGRERIRFSFSANRGEPLAPLASVASGGELSRLMLAIHVVSGTDVPTVVFDEVDAGVGGQTARAVGELLRRMATERQVLVVTHLPQVAAYAHAHFAVTKEDRGGRTVTRVARLDDEQREAELARMLSGAVTDASLRNARELLAAAAAESR
jgi:di/tricarboxylate transporter